MASPKPRKTTSLYKPTSVYSVHRGPCWVFFELSRDSPLRSFQTPSLPSFCAEQGVATHSTPQQVPGHGRCAKVTPG